jgi:hypothetical protein
MDDEGTRLQFLTELYELWQTALDILERYDKHAPFYTQKKTELENASKLLMYHMQKDYHDAKDAAAINSLPPHAEDITDEIT